MQQPAEENGVANIANAKAVAAGAGAKAAPAQVKRRYVQPNMRFTVGAMLPG